MTEFEDGGDGGGGGGDGGGGDGDDDVGAGPPFRTFAAAQFAFIVVGAVGVAIAVVALAVWVSLDGPLAVESPFLWTAIIGFWAGSYSGVYAFDVETIERALGELPLDAAGIRVFWLRAPRKGGYAAAVEVRARTTDARLPREFAVFLNVGLLWDLHVVGIECVWSCKESGVLYLAPKRSRFLGGETCESLGLPSQEAAVLRGLLRRPEDPQGPDWGAPAGEYARRTLDALGAESWLFGAEQPFVAFEARDGAIEKFWSPLAARLAPLDVFSAFDIVQIVRAFDRDAIASRVSRPTSSPSALPPSSPRP